MNKLSITILTFLLLSCQPEKTSPTKIVSQYYEAFNTAEFNKLAPLLQDSFAVAEGEYITPYTIDSYYEHFKWDSVFQTSYEITKLVESDNQITVTVSSSSVRYKFLKNDPLICPFRFTIENNKISKIDALECVNADWSIWQQERDTLVSWIKQNHPELDGFIHDLTVKGAVDYLKAIELYERRNQ